MLALIDDVERSHNVAKDRRIFGRAGNAGVAEGRRLDHTISAHRQPRMSLVVKDVSLSGMSAVSDVPALRGEHVGVYFPSNTGRGGWGALGRVVRCEPGGAGYRIAVEFDPLPAA